MIYNRLKKDDAIEVIFKLVGESCNINCLYCYEKRHPEKTIRKLTLDTISSFLNNIDSSAVSVGLHGGEPLLLSIEELEEILRLLYESDKVKEISLQTNALLIERKHLELFSKYNVCVGISWDGFNDKFRVDYSGRSVSDKVFEKILMLEDHNIPYGIIFVVTRSNYKYSSEIYNKLKSFKLLYTISFVPCFDYSVSSRELRGISGKLIARFNSGVGVPDWAITPLEYQSFLDEYYMLWSRHNISYIVEPFMSVINKKIGQEPSLCTFSDTKCAHTFTFYPDGVVTGCDIYEKGEIKNYNFRDQNTLIDVSNSSYSQQNLHIKKCEGCSVLEVCRGGCMSTRNSYYGTPYYEEYCSHRKSLINMVKVDNENKCNF